MATTTIGVVSDTHGLLRPQALRRLRGVDRIVHAGDIGSLEVLHALEAVAPVTAVIAGHSHKPSLTEQDGVLYMNPGSIGPRRFTLPIAMGFLTVRGTRVRGEIVYLDV
jgi:uncharacterized protein